MNQKLRTARSGLVILFALLCIVCLSLSLALSAHFAAYAADEEFDTLLMQDMDGRDLWQIHYFADENGENVEKIESLMDGIENGKPISYVETRDGISGILYGEASQTNFFTPYRNTELTIKLNPQYIYNGKTLDESYDLANAVYNNNTETGEARDWTGVGTTVELTAKEGQESLKLKKEWRVVALGNMIDVADDYVSDYLYGDVSVSCEIVKPKFGSTVIYHFSSVLDDSIATIAVENNGAGLYSYKAAFKNSDGTFDLSAGDGYGNIWDEEVNAAANGGEGHLINYKLHRLNALVADEQFGQGAYTLTISSMSYVDESNDIHYAGVSIPVSFSVRPQNLSEDFDKFQFGFKSNSSSDLLQSINVEYTGDDSWMPTMKLTLGNIELEAGMDYTVTASSNTVGDIELTINGNRNLEGSYTITGKVRITPAENEWKKDAMPGIVTWMYGTYKPENNLIVGMPKYIDNISDVKFRIVALVEELSVNGNEIIVKEQDIEGLTDIHYYIDPTNNQTDGRVTADVSKILKDLNVGKYRLYASVYGATIGSSTFDRNYLPIEETSVDFEIFKGSNSWKAGAEPSILGWTAGKLETTDGLFNAEAEFGGTPILMIYKLGENGGKDILIYSNLPEHAITEFGDIDVLKSLKAGRYYLSAVVDGTDNYTGLKATVLFDVVPNNLPVWAVILIVAGSLGIVAVVFAILHQKGILQMLTGKVIISMRTRANVDATLAAIRAAKVAREAEASIAAAKAREAEEAAKAETATKADKPENK